MTVDGKVMSVTERELGAIALATGACDEDDFVIMGADDVGVVWLAMTGETRYRWQNGFEHPTDAEIGYGPELEAIHAGQRERWYA